MKFSLKLCLVLLALLLPAFPQEGRSPLNTGLPEWLTLGFQARWRPEFQVNQRFAEDNDQNYLLQRYRLQLTLKPTAWLRFNGELNDSRVFWKEAPANNEKDTLDLRHAWIELGKSDAGWWDVRVGRQTLAFGSERVIGGTEWANVSRVFDAAKLAIHKGKDRVDIFSASLVRVDSERWDHHRQGDNLHGIYASLGSLLPDAQLEPYVLMRTAQRERDDFGQIGKYYSYTVGVRADGAIGPRWAYEAEIVGQRGEYGQTPSRGSAALIQIVRAFPDVRLQPSLLAEFNYASGDDRQGDGRVGTYDQLYPTNHGPYGVADQVGRRNTRQFKSGAGIRPKAWLNLRVDHHFYWLDSRFDDLYAAGGSILVPAPASGAVSRYVGREIDLIADARLFRYYRLGLQLGHLLPGTFLETYTPGANRTFLTFYLDFRL